MRQTKIGNKYCLGRIISPETREKIRQAALGRKHSPEWCEGHRQAMLGNKHLLGHKHSPETKERMRQTALQHPTFCPESRQKIREALLGRKRSPEVCEKIRQARLCQHFPSKMTSIERLLRDEFKKRRLHFEMHRTMFRKWQPDFVFEQACLIVQADGDYWHSRPEVRRRDAAFNEAAKAGWTVWRFGEREIKMHAPACARAVARFVRDHVA